MKISREKLHREAQATGFRPEILEKVIQLLNLLEAIQGHPFIEGRLALKGGTALNLFYFDVPRLSIDIDLNYVGAPDRETMLEERPKLEEAVAAVCAREGFTVRRLPADHAGGKWRMSYESSLNQSGNLEKGGRNHWIRWTASTGLTGRLHWNTQPLQENMAVLP